jgi:hypothetical protein
MLYQYTKHEQSASVGGWLRSLLTAKSDTKAAHPAGDDNFITLDCVARLGRR